MNRLTSNILDLTWDEYVNAVDNELLLESGEVASEDELADVCTAYDTGLTPLACAHAIADWRLRTGSGLSLTNLAA